MFDVDPKRNDGWDGHGWWLEVWVNEDPALVPYHEAAGVASYPRNGVGFQIAPYGDAFDNVTVNTVGAKFIVVRDYQVLREDVISQDPPTIRLRDRVDDAREVGRAAPDARPARRRCFITPVGSPHVAAIGSERRDEIFCVGTRKRRWSSRCKLLVSAKLALSHFDAGIGATFDVCDPFSGDR